MPTHLNTHAPIQPAPPARTIFGHAPWRKIIHVAFAGLGIFLGVIAALFAALLLGWIPFSC